MRNNAKLITRRIAIICQMAQAQDRFTVSYSEHCFRIPFEIYIAGSKVRSGVHNLRAAHVGHLPQQVCRAHQRPVTGMWIVVTAIFT